MEKLMGFEAKSLEEELYLTRSFFENVLENSPDAIGIVNKQGLFIRWNRRATELFGYDFKELEGQHFKSLYVHQKDIDQVMTSLKDKGYIRRFEVELWKKGQVAAPFEISVSILHDQEGNRMGSICVTRDMSSIKRTLTALKDINAQMEWEITQRRKAEQALHASILELEKMANLDGLTGLYNRRKFDSYLREEWERQKRAKNPVALALLDVDFFKRFNDTYGHQEGDDCLRSVAHCLMAHLRRRVDLPARYGGEEFALVLPFTDLGGASHFADTLRRKIAELRIPHGSSLCAQHVTVSIGITAGIPHGDLEVEDLVEAADQALYKAKERGRNNVVAVPLPPPSA